MQPQPIVQKKNGRTRTGKGFSRGEIREAGAGFRQALKVGIPIDLRRKTKREENVKVIKQYLRSLSSKKKPKPRVPRRGKM